MLFLVGPAEAGSIFDDGTLGIGCNNGCTHNFVVAGSGNLVQGYCACGSLGLWVGSGGGTLLREAGEGNVSIVFVATGSIAGSNHLLTNEA